MNAVIEERRGSVLILKLNNPPVNGLGAALRTALVGAIKAGQANNEIAAFVISGEGRMYSAGAHGRMAGSLGRSCASEGSCRANGEGTLSNEVVSLSASAWVAGVGKNVQPSPGGWPGRSTPTSENERPCPFKGLVSSKLGCRRPEPL